MAINTNVTVGTTATPILDKDTHRKRPPFLVNTSGEIVTLTYADDTDTVPLDPGEQILAPTYMDVTGTSASGTAVVQIRQGIPSSGVIGNGGAYDAATGSMAVKEIAPVYTHVGPVKETKSALGDGTVYFYLDMETYRFLSIDIIDTPGSAGTNTYTVEATGVNDGTDQTAITTYTDVTQKWFLVASATTSAYWERDTAIAAKYVRVKMVRTSDGGSTDGAATIHWTRTY